MRTITEIEKEIKELTAKGSELRDKYGVPSPELEEYTKQLEALWDELDIMQKSQTI